MTLCKHRLGPTSSEGWQPEDTWPELLIERVYGYACGVIGTAMVIAGGEQWSGSYLKSTELVDLATRASRHASDTSLVLPNLEGGDKVSISKF